MAWANRSVFFKWKNTHTHHISADNHTKEDRFKEKLLILQDIMDDQIQKNTEIFVRREITAFIAITIISTHMTWILLMQVQEIRSVFGSEFT